MIEVYKRFKELLPPLTKAEMEHLEQSVLDEGIREPIRVWENKIVDGHNRFFLAKEFDLPFETEEMIFPDEDSVCEWMMINQLGRRNLEPNVKTLLIGQLYELQKRKVGRPQVVENKESENSDTVSELNQSTAEKIAKEFDVAPRTVERSEKVAQAFKAVDEKTQEAFKKGEVSQKALVEKAKPKPEPKEIDETRFDSFTNNAKHHGNQIDNAIRLLKGVVLKAHTYFEASGVSLKVFAEKLALLNMDKESLNAKSLKSLELCPHCSGKKCVQCDDQGYVFGTIADSMRKELE